MSTGEILRLALLRQSLHARPMRAVSLGFLLITFGLLAGVDRLRAEEPLGPGIYAEFTTPRGNLLAELYFTRAPLTVASFVGLAEGELGPAPRKPFFDGLTFHRVVPGFVVQGGDPRGTGEGGPGYSFPDEFVPGLRHDAIGVLSMANSGPDTNGSQFFFTLAPVNRLNYLHSVFGRLIRGLDVLPRIQKGDTMTVKILRVGEAAKAFRVDEASFHALIARAPRATPAHFDDPDGVLPASPPRAKGFDNKLANFERATGTKLYVRVYETFTPEPPSQRPAAVAEELAKELKLGSDATLAVYFAKDRRTGIWVGDSILNQFSQKGSSVDELVKSGTLHEAEQALIDKAEAEAERAIADAIKAAPAAQPVTDGQKIKQHLDALIDALIFRLEPKPQ